MVIFPLAPEQKIAQIWSNGARGGQVSQGSAATDLRWGENFNKFLFRNSLLYIAVKKLRKPVDICQSYHKNKRVSFFMAHSVVFFLYLFEIKQRK